MFWQISDRFEARLLGDCTKADENGDPLVFAAINTAATFPRVASRDAGCPGTGPIWNSVPAVPNVNDPRCANNYQNAGPYNNNGTAPLVSTLENWGASAQLRYGLNDALSFKLISAYRSVDWTGNRDADNTPLTILHTVYDVTSWQWSHELRALRWTPAGVRACTFRQAPRYRN
jgi:iron complex outermembrane receptor protein